MKQLSAFKYIKNNMKKVITTILALLMGVFVVYFFFLATDTTIKAIDYSNGNISKKLTFVSGKNGEGIQAEVVEELRKDENTKYLIATKPTSGGIRYHGGLSSSSSSVFNLYSEDMDSFIDMVGVTLIEGNYPKEESNEIVVTDKFLKQNNLSLGDKILKENLNLGLNEDYTICGVVSGDVNLGIINNKNSIYKKEDILKRFFVYKTKDDSSLDLSKNKLFSNVGFEDYTTIKKQIDSSLVSLNLFTKGLSIFMIVILCLTLSNLNIINFYKRKSEMFILRALGYEKRFLFLKLWKENLATCFIGYALGIVLTTVVIYVLNVIIFTPSGSDFVYFSSSGIIISALIPLCVSVFSLLPCFKALRQIKN